MFGQLGLVHPHPHAHARPCAFARRFVSVLSVTTTVVVAAPGRRWHVMRGSRDVRQGAWVAGWARVNRGGRGPPSGRSSLQSRHWVGLSTPPIHRNHLGPAAMHESKRTLSVDQDQTFEQGDGPRALWGHSMCEATGAYGVGRVRAYALLESFHSLNRVPSSNVPAHPHPRQRSRPQPTAAASTITCPAQAHPPSERALRWRGACDRADYATRPGGNGKRRPQQRDRLGDSGGAAPWSAGGSHSCYYGSSGQEACRPPAF